jgi:hypothetical protein
MTAVNTTFFDGDYKTLSGRAQEGRRLIRSADRWINEAKQMKTDADREAALFYVQKNARDLAELVAGGRKGGELAAPEGAHVALLPFATVFAAAQSGCDCANLAQKDAVTYRYFCGRGVGGSLTEARVVATQAAVEQAASALQKNATVTAQTRNRESLSAYVRRVATEVDACPSKASNGFTMYVLLRIPVTMTTSAAQVAFAPNVYSPRLRVTLEKIRVLQDGSSGSSGWIFDIKSGGQALTLPSTNYRDTPKLNEVVPTVKGVEQLVLEIDGNMPVEISGRRSFNGDTAVGNSRILPGQQSITVPVRNAANATRGSFEFIFSVTPIR